MPFKQLTSLTRTTIVFIILSFSINASGQNLQNTIADHYKTSKFDVAIFPANSLDIIPGTRFTPTKKEIELAEIALSNQLEFLNKPLVNQQNSPIIHKKIKKFKRQYFRYIDETGQRVLLINSFWKKSKHEDWLNRKVSVLDGGSYYWSVKYSLINSKIYDLYINGSG